MSRRNSGAKIVWREDRECFYITWTEKGRSKRLSTGTADHREAQKVLAEFIDYKALELSDDNTPNDLLIGDVLTYYLENHAPTAADPARIAHCVAALMPFWQDKYLTDITQTTCNKYAVFRERAPGTVRRELGTLVAAQNFLVRERRLSAPVHVPLPQKPDAKDRWLTVEEAASLLWAAKNGYAHLRSYLPLFILIGLYTGARSGAILSLTWDRVDLDARVIDFRVPGERRTKKRKSTVPIPRQLMTFLKLAYKRRSADDGPVVHNDGQPIQKIRKSFVGAVKRAGLGPEVTPHTLRHTCGTWMAQRGVQLWQIAGFLAQDSATTEKNYAHHHPDHMQEAREGLENRKRREPAE